MATRLCRSEKYRCRPRDVRRCLVHAANYRGGEGEGSDAAARKGTGNADAVIGALFLCHKASVSGCLLCAIFGLMRCSKSVCWLADGGNLSSWIRRKNDRNTLNLGICSVAIDDHLCEHHEIAHRHF